MGVHGKSVRQGNKVGILTSVTSIRVGITRGRIQSNNEAGIKIGDMVRGVTSATVRVKSSPHYG